MSARGWFQILLFLSAVAAVTVPLGRYMTCVFARRRTWLHPVLGPIERLVYRLTRVDPASEMDWREYTASLLLFSAASLVGLFAILRLQSLLPWNPQGVPGMPAFLAFNTAASFVTNTDWQNYAGEQALSYFSQMAGLTCQNFVSAAAGMAVAVAVIRGLAAREASTLGNFWVDLTRSVLWILLPLSIVGALVLVSQGVVQNFRPYDRVVVLDQAALPQTTHPSVSSPGPLVQVIAQGPVASQEIIKQLGTNGGGFFNANSAHPFENPTPLTNFLEMLAIFAIPAGLVYTFGEMTGARRHAWVVWAVMAVLFLAGVTVMYAAETSANPLLPTGASSSADHGPAGNFEGKEVRFGIASSAIFATATTDASCGAVNAMHDSLMPLGGMVALLNIMLGEVIFGGVGSGLYGMLVFVILAVFIAGLMVGRTPEYLGKKIQAFDVQMAMLAILVFPLVVLALAAISAVMESGGHGAISNPGPHGLTQVLYAFVSAGGNNGSAFAGLAADTPWYNVALGITMLVGRFLVIVPVLALAGSLARKKIVPASAGTFPVHTPLFGALLVAVILIVGALTFFPALSLGPIIEHLMLVQHRMV